MTKLYHDDCFNIFPQLEDKSIDLVLCDMPYGTTACKWDTVLDLELMWKELKRIVKNNAAIVLTAAQPFTSVLITSELDLFKYTLVWKKSKISHFARAPYRFLTEHEDILIFSSGGCSKNSINRMKYNPQDLKDCHKICKGKGHSDHRPSNKIQSDYTQTKTNYPKSILEFKSDGAKSHPIQKPVALMEYLIKTYSNEGDTVLDFCMGSGTTGVPLYRLPDGTESMYKTHISAKMVGIYLFRFTEFNYLLTFLKNLLIE